MPHPSKHTRVRLLSALAAGAISLPLLVCLAPPGPASAKDGRHPRDRVSALQGPRKADLQAVAGNQLAKDSSRRSHPRPPHPRRAGSAGVASGSAGALLAGALRAGSPAAAATASTLVLYDTTGQWGYLGELYASSVANLAGHFGTVKAEPISSYTAGQVNAYTATVYIGSTYGEPVPVAFSTDTLASAHPVLWMNDNIWTMAGQVGVSAFTSRYGWDPTNSWFAPGGSVGSITAVSYAGQSLPRTLPAGTDGGVLHPTLVPAGNPAVKVLATGQDTSTSPATAVPWAIRSGNLTYLGEIPFSYVSEGDRLIALEDLLFDALAPATAVRHRAMVRLEDISPTADPASLRSFADYLKAQGVPFGVNVIPVYTDPKGVYNNGVPQTITLAQAPAVVAAIKYMLSRGGTLLDHGDTHQYAALENPYTGVTGDDFEFYRSHIDAGDNVVLDGPTGEDSTAWANQRIQSAKQQFALAGLPVPSIWVTPHYAASDTDYRAIGKAYSARYERTLYFSGVLSGRAPACTAASSPCQLIGQLLPYPVRDIYGGLVLPENLGNYEPEPANNHPARLPAALIASARANLAIRDGFASFFYHPSYPLQPLQEIVQGIKGLGYTFVAPSSVTVN